MAEQTFARINELLDEGEQHRERGRFPRALSCYRRALGIALHLDGERTPDIAHLKNEYADTLYQTGDYAHAEREVTRALEIIDDVIDDGEGEEKHFILLRSLSLLGTLHREQGRYQEAERLFTRAIDESRARFGEDSEPMSDALNNLAIVYKYTANFDEALKLYTRALQIAQKNHGDTNSAASLYHNLGGLEHARGQSAETEDEARECYLRGEPHAYKAYELRVKLLGQEHPATMADLAAYAGILDGLGRYKESEQIYRKTIAFFEDFYGEVHYEVAISVNNLAIVLDETGRYAEAERAYRRAYQIKLALFGKRHIEIGFAANNLGVFLLEQGQTRLARRYLQQALGIFTKTLSPEHPSLHSCQKRLEELD